MEIKAQNWFCYKSVQLQPAFADIVGYYDYNEEGWNKYPFRTGKNIPCKFAIIAGHCAVYLNNPDKPVRKYATRCKTSYIDGKVYCTIYDNDHTFTPIV